MHGIWHHLVTIEVVFDKRTTSSRLRNIGGCPESLSSFAMKKTRDEDRWIHGTVCRSHVARVEALNSSLVKSQSAVDSESDIVDVST